MTDTASAKHEDYLVEKRDFENEKDIKFDDDLNLEEEPENSPIEAVRLGTRSVTSHCNLGPKITL